MAYENHGSAEIFQRLKKNVLRVHVKMVGRFVKHKQIHRAQEEFKKRDPAMYPHVCGLLGVSLEDTWFFDDSWYALQTAHDAGLHTVGVFSADQCGTHEQLAAYGELVVDNFLGLDVADF